MHFLNNHYETTYQSLEEENGEYFTAIVISKGEEKEYKDVYEIEVQNGIKLLLNIKKSKNKNIKLNYGDKIEFYLEYERPSSARNYMGFDYSLYLRTKKIYGTVNVKQENIKIISHDNTNIVLKQIYKLRNLMKKQINKLLPEETAGLCMGMLIGDISNIDENMQENFRNSNLSHILAVSGANVSYIIVSITYIFNKMCFRKRLSKIISIFLLILFMLLTGCTASVNRACIMAILMLIADLLYRKSDVYNNLAISALILLIINPYTALDIGFQLSYMGTIGIVFLHDKVSNIIKTNNKIIKYFLEMIYVTTCANIAIIPIMMFHFNTLSLTFYFSNVLAGPILGVVVIVGFIMFFISLIFNPIAIVIAFVLNLMLKFIIKIAEITASMPFSKIIITTPSILFIALWYFTILVAVYWKKAKEIFIKKKKIISSVIAVLIVIILITNLLTNINRNLTIHFIDVGQGDSCLIITPLNKRILIDGGGSEIGSFDVGEKTLLPYLLDRKIKKLDYIIISHFDSDHIGGLFTIMENLKVENIIISKQGEESENLIKFQEIVKNKKSKVIIVEKGDYIKIDNTTYLEILFPNKKLIKANVLNNNSIVAKLNCMGTKIMFTGDIEEIAEKELCNLYKNTDKLKADILKVAHHGSKTSSIEEFLKLVNPKIALIGVGASNNFGHPNTGVLNRLENMRYKNI